MAKAEKAISVVEDELAQEIFGIAQEDIDVGAVLDRIGYFSPQLKLREMSLRKFRINMMKVFTSKLTASPAIHAICTDLTTGEYFQTVIGCQNGLELLIPMYNKGIRGGLIIMFEYVTQEGGTGFYRIVH
jgi:hypothetical protein